MSVTSISAAMDLGDGPEGPGPVPVDGVVPLHPLIDGRHSPRAYDPRGEVSDPQLRSILEAARWAPSSVNRQPWRFVVARRDSALYPLLYGALTENNQRWAGRAPVLVAAFAETAGEDGHPYRSAPYDLGLAVAQMTLQAESLGLKARQMGGFDKPGVAEALGVPSRFKPVVIVAIGTAGQPHLLPEDLQDRERQPRVRRALTDTVYDGEWGSPASL